MDLFCFALRLCFSFIGWGFRHFCYFGAWRLLVCVFECLGFVTFRFGVGIAMSFLFLGLVQYGFPGFDVAFAVSGFLVWFVPGILYLYLSLHLNLVLFVV